MTEAGHRGQGWSHGGDNLQARTPGLAGAEHRDERDGGQRYRAGAAGGAGGGRQLEVKLLLMITLTGPLPLSQGCLVVWM